MSRPEIALLRDNLHSLRLVAGRLGELRECLAGRRLLPTAAGGAPRPFEDHVLLDSFLLRFASLTAVLQDGVHRDLTVLEQEGERPRTARDRADFMEKLGALPSSALFSEIVRTRSALAHAYPADTEAQARVMNGAWTYVGALLDAGRAAEACAVARFPEAAG